MKHTIKAFGAVAMLLLGSAVYGSKANHFSSFTTHHMNQLNIIHKGGGGIHSIIVIVLDAANNPVEGASVKIASLKLEGTTNKEGIAIFEVGDPCPLRNGLVEVSKAECSTSIYASCGTYHVTLCDQ